MTVLQMVRALRDDPPPSVLAGVGPDAIARNIHAVELAFIHLELRDALIMARSLREACGAEYRVDQLVDQLEAEVAENVVAAFRRMERAS